MQIVISFLITFLPLFFVVGFAEQFELPKTSLLTAVAFVWLGKKLIDASAARSIHSKFDLLGFTFLLIAFSAFMSTLFSINQRMSIFGQEQSMNGLVVQLSYVVLYFAVRENFSGPSEGRSILRLTIFPTAVASTYALLQFFNFDPIHWQRVLDNTGWLRPSSTVGHTNFLSAYLSMTFPILLMEIEDLWQKRAKVKLYATVALLLQSLLVIGLCQSRGSWFALVGAVIVYSVLRFTWPITRTLKLLSLVGIIVLVVTKIASGRMGALLSPGIARNEYWLGALRIWKRYPFFGSGTDTFYLAFQHQRTPKYWIAEWAGAPHRAHNEFLNFAATQGTFGIFCILAFTTVLGFLALHVHRRVTSEGRSTLNVLIALIVAFYIQNLTSFTVSSTGTLFVVACAILSNLLKLENFTNQPRYFWPSILAATFFLFYANFPPNANYTTLSIITAVAATTAATFQLQTLLAIPLTLVFIYFVAVKTFASLETRIALNLVPTAPKEALIEAEKAATINPNDAQSVFFLSNLAENFTALTTDSNSKRNFRELAIRGYIQATKLVPAFGSYHYSLAFLLARQIGDGFRPETDKGILFASLARAIELEPTNPIYYAGITLILLTQRSFIEASLWANRALEIYPNAAIFHFYAGHANFELSHDEIAKKHLELALNGEHFFMTENRHEAIFSEALKNQAKIELQTIANRTR